MGKLFGTDGIRGVVGKTLTAELAFHVGQTVAVVLQEELGRSPLITIGKDTRVSSDMLEAALTAGICSVGGDVLLLGVIPTPAVAFLTVQEKADAGVVISASHNPYEYNGIKVFNGQGYKLPDAMEERVEELILNHAALPVKSGGELGRCRNGAQEMHDDYVSHLMDTIGCDLSGLRVMVDCANGAAAATAPDLFQRLPVMADFINIDPDGVNINNGCGSTHLEQLSAMTVAGKYQLGIAFDGDADRCLAVDERGRVVDGDQILYVCGVYLNKHGRLSGGTVVPTIASNFGLVKSLELAGLSAVTSGVGDRHVYAKMREGGYSLGGEQTGHTIFGDIERTGDGIMTSLRVMEVIRAERETLSQLTAPCKLLPQAQVAVRVADKDAALENMGVQNAIAEAEAALAGEGRVLVRKSGTESVIRVLAEAPDQASADAAMKRIANALEAL